MKIKGYIPADTKLATEDGVEFSYPVTVGSEVYNFKFLAKTSGTENKAFQKAGEKLNHKRGIREKTKYIQPIEEGLREMLALWYDHIIVSWDNDVVDEDDVPFGNSRETFLDLLGTDLFLGVYMSLQADCGEYTNFNKTVEAKAEKN